MQAWTIGRLLDKVTPYLSGKGSASPRLDAELLLAEVLGLERIDLYTQHERPLTEAELGAYRALVARRAAHEPVAYILGRAYFRHLCLEVTPVVLIPRPETEELVEVALETLRRRPPWGGLPAGAPGAGGASVHSPAAGPASPGPPAPVVADVGTGTGAIALSLAQEAGVRVLATERSADALAVAAKNAARLGLAGLVEFRQTDLLEGVASAGLRLVVSNPPYLTEEDLAAVAPDVRDFEPLAALDGGADGLDVYRRLVPQAGRALGPGGTLLLEVGHTQATAVEAVAWEAGFAVVAVHKDLSRKDRIVAATRPGAHVLDLAALDAAAVGALRQALAAGAVIGVPTDTVYGLAARWDSPVGVRRVFAAKGRAPEQPLAVLFPSVAAVKKALPDLHPRAAAVLGALLPGPYTFVVATASERPPQVGTPDSLGVRVPGHGPLLDFLQALDVPLAATSANRSGLPDPTSLADVDADVLAQCSAALAPPAQGRGGARAAGAVGVASTVVDLRPLAAGAAAVVLREGAVPAAEVLARIAEVD